MRSEYVSNRFIFNIENSNRNDIKNKNLYLWFSFFWPHFIPFAWFSTFIVQTTKRNVLIKIHVSQPGWWRELNSWIIRWCDVKLSQYDVAMELQYRGLSWLIPKRVDSCSSIGYGCKLASHGAKKTEMCLKKKEKKNQAIRRSHEKIAIFNTVLHLQYQNTSFRCGARRFCHEKGLDAFRVHFPQIHRCDRVSFAVQARGVNRHNIPCYRFECRTLCTFW